MSKRMRGRALLACVLVLSCRGQDGARSAKSSPSEPALATDAAAVATAPDAKPAPSPKVHGGALVDFAIVARGAEPAVVFDIRYATANNFTKTAVYTVARCLLRPKVAKALLRVHERVAKDGFGLYIWDCYRPASVQNKFWALVPDPRYVARPVFKDGVPVKGSKHNRGAAVDLTLSRGGVAVAMPTDYDDFSKRAHRGNKGWSDAERTHAQALEAAMVAEGFSPMPTEWWHFDGPKWREYELLDLPLDGSPRPSKNRK